MKRPEMTYFQGSGHFTAALALKQADEKLVEQDLEAAHHLYDKTMELVLYAEHLEKILARLEKQVKKAAHDLKIRNAEISLMREKMHKMQDEVDVRDAAIRVLEKNLSLPPTTPSTPHST